MQSKTISICVAVLAGVTASIGVAIFAPRTSADENSALPAGSASESVVESADLPSIAESIVESEVSSTVPKNMEESKVDSSSSEAVNIKSEDSSSEVESSSKPDYPTTIVTKGGITGTEASPQSNTPSSASALGTASASSDIGVAVPGVDGARPVANDPATPAK